MGRETVKGEHVRGHGKLEWDPSNTNQLIFLNTKSQTVSCEVVNAHNLPLSLFVDLVFFNKFLFSL